MVFYKCDDCDALITVLSEETTCIPTCCGEQMKTVLANSTEGAMEKHMPSVTAEGSKVTVRIGSEDHPMLEGHYITTVILETRQGFQKKTLNPGAEPYAEFMVTDDDAPIAVYEYCNLHGLWRTEVEVKPGILERVKDTMGL